jgi:hypothetical protein
MACLDDLQRQLTHLIKHFGEFTFLRNKLERLLPPLIDTSQILVSDYST